MSEKRERKENGRKKGETDTEATHQTGDYSGVVQRPQDKDFRIFWGVGAPNCAVQCKAIGEGRGEGGASSLFSLVHWFDQTEAFSAYPQQWWTTQPL